MLNQFYSVMCRFTACVSLQSSNVEMIGGPWIVWESGLYYLGIVTSGGESYMKLYSVVHPFCSMALDTLGGAK